MDQEFNIELFEEYDGINFYTIRLKGEPETEVEKFLLKFPEGSIYDNEIDRILSWLEKISEKGALERYFRPEGRYGDGVGAIPIEVGKVRLYCIRISDHILIIGNGGVKDANSWENSPILSKHVELLLDAARFIKSRISEGSIRIINEGKEFCGNLRFTRYEKK